MSEQIEVTQADIDLCNELWKMSVNWGNREDMTDMIARHRIAHTQQSDTPVAEPRTIYVQFSDNGNIRKWAWTEFDLAEKLKVETLPVSDISIKIKNTPDVIDVIQSLLERGRVMFDNDGWLISEISMSRNVAALVEAAKAFLDGADNGHVTLSVDDALRKALAPFAGGV